MADTCIMLDENGRKIPFRKSDSFSAIKQYPVFDIQRNLHRDIFL